MENAITVKNLSKNYMRGSREKYLSLRDTLTDILKSPLKKRSEEFLALDNISFEVKKGETVGIIGRNGAGKSTLLKILSRITYPTNGEIILNGKVSSLLEVGTGFHPELTGRENIYLNGSILGMKHKEIARKFDSIVEFSGLNDFIDTQVKKYSSGMYVRLAFSVASHLEPDILLVDEVLAVGDYDFQKKSIGRMSEITKTGKTILFVSHNLGAVAKLCERSILIDKGRLVAFGPTVEIIEQYLNNFSSENINPVSRNEFPDLRGPKISQVRIIDKNGKLKNSFNSLEKFKVEIELNPAKKSNLKDFSAIWFLHNNLDDQIAVGASYPMDNIRYRTDTKKISFDFDPVSLTPGRYRFRFVLNVPNIEDYDSWDNAIAFEITHNDHFDSGFLYPGYWEAKQFINHKWDR